MIDYVAVNLEEQIRYLEKRNEDAVDLVKRERIRRLNEVYLRRLVSREYGLSLERCDYEIR